MKKIMLIAAVAIACSAHAKLTKDSTEAEFRAVADAALACTNARGVAMMLQTNDFWACSIGPRLANFRTAYDAQLANKLAVMHTLNFPIWVLPAWPLVSELGCEARGVKTNTPYIYGKAKELNCYLIPRYVAGLGDFDVAVGVLSEMIAKRQVYFTIHITEKAIDHIATVKRIIQRGAEKSVKRWLRKQGKSFVTKDGVNPCAEKMTVLNAALNAPRLAGLNEWFADMGLECRVDVSGLPAAGAVEEIKEQVLDGDKNLDASTMAMLYICLGVDGYNAFVKEYNGDK